MSKSETGGEFYRKLSNLSEGGLEAMLALLPMLVEQRLASGEITTERAEALKKCLREFEDAKNLPLEIRAARMREIASKMAQDLGDPQMFQSK